MDLRHMRHFVAVAEELHFGRAARRLNMAQPPVSQSIRRLEDDLGVILFNRSRRGVELTEAGRIFLAEARRTLMQAELARKMARRAVLGTDEVRISFVSAALNDFLPRLIVKVHEEHPDIRLDLSEATSPEQVDGLLAGEFDVAFVLGESEYSEAFERFTVERSRYVAAVPASWSIAGRESITLAELAGLPFIRPPEKLLRRTPEMLAIFQGIGALPNSVQETRQSGVTLSLIGAGLGCSVITATTQMRPPPDVRFLTIADHPPHRRWELVMIWNGDHLNRSNAAFIETVKSYVAANPDFLELA